MMKKTIKWTNHRDKKKNGNTTEVDASRAKVLVRDGLAVEAPASGAQSAAAAAQKATTAAGAASSAAASASPAQQPGEQAPAPKAGPK